MYKINYDQYGKPCSIQKDNMSIPIAEGNSDFKEFLLWNDKQEVKLDFNSSIPVVYPVYISTSSNVMIGDGIDEILLSVTGEPGALLVIDTLCGGTAGSIDIQLDETGNGSQVFSCETSPNVITFSCGGVSTKVRAL